MSRAISPTTSNRITALARPFVYIASLRRTGSTVLAEALTHPPTTFIFREPHFGRNRFNLKADDIDRFATMGLDMASLREAWLSGRKNRHVLDALKEDFIPSFSEHFLQIGVKEIRHEGWRTYAQAFPGMKVVLTGRDPRDIYISLFNRFHEGVGSWKQEPTPEAVANALLEQFAYQREIAAETDCLRVRYEDFCTHPHVMDSIRRHIQSPLPGVGKIGAFLSSPNHPRRSKFDVHGKSITTQRVSRWRSESNESLLQHAQHCFELMPQYVEFWEYHAT